MATYTVTSGFADLAGSCDIDSSDNCTSYTSTNLGAATRIQNLGSGSSGVFFQVDLPGSGNVYTINAPSDGTGFSGQANNGNAELRPTDTDEPWAATATQEPAVAAKANY